ncbi:unnamed protein product [Durusdinium trenchii]|uniref:Uncharacterized protein n=1 Tax=Durusdinium trenchii TaxID=1381693 RepID=A0ABP0Q750_9DINO
MPWKSCAMMLNEHTNCSCVLLNRFLDMATCSRCSPFPEIGFFQEAMSLISKMSEASTYIKRKAETAMRPQTRIGVGRPVYSIGQLVRFIMLGLHLRNADDFKAALSAALQLASGSSEFIKESDLVPDGPSGSTFTRARLRRE